jgi:hypothetical protein
MNYNVGDGLINSTGRHFKPQGLSWRNRLEKLF